MRIHRNTPMFAAVAAGLLAVATSPATHSQSIIRLVSPDATPRPLHDLPVASTAAVDLSPSTRISGSCVDANTDGVCDFGTDSSGLLPPQITNFGVSAAVPAGGSRPRVEVGEVFFASWQTSRAEVCLPQAPSRLDGWSGMLPLASTGDQPAGGMRFTSLPPASSLPANIGLTCYGVRGRVQSVVSIDVVPPPDDEEPPPPPPPGGCPTSGLIAPTKWGNSGIDWQRLGGNPAYPPNGATRTIVLGAYSYISAPFVPGPTGGLSMSLASNQTTLDPTWEGMFIGISECAADFRFGVQTPPINEPTLSTACRRTVTGPEIGVNLFSVTDTSQGVCKLTPGKTYYLNMIQAGSEVGILNGISDCPGNQCGFQIKF